MGDVLIYIFREKVKQIREFLLPILRLHVHICWEAEYLIILKIELYM